MIPSGIRFSLTDFVVVSDAGLMSRTNIRLLKSAGYKFILGGRIKKEAGVIKDWLFSLNPQDGVIHERLMGNDDRIIVSYSAKRASKDAFNRQKGIERLQKAYKSGKITKKSINQRDYNKFLKVEKDIAVTIDYTNLDKNIHL